MPKWEPTAEWEGEDVYIIGGGSSLATFDWRLLRGKRTVGCNSAFILGHEICHTMIFADFVWWSKIGLAGTAEYGGRVVGCSPRLSNKRFAKDAETPWLLIMDRAPERGLHTTRLAWAGNVGGMALNLALILGAKRVFLLGFDMKLGPGVQKYQAVPGKGSVRTSPGRANWHDVRHEQSQRNPYTRFIREFKNLADTLPKVFPGCEVFNVTDGSDLPWFPTLGMEEHFGCETQLRKDNTA